VVRSKQKSPLPAPSRAFKTSVLLALRNGSVNRFETLRSYVLPPVQWPTGRIQGHSTSSQRTRGDSLVTPRVVVVAVFVPPLRAPQLKPDRPRGVRRAAAAFVNKPKQKIPLLAPMQRPPRGLPNLPRTEASK
ncbi:unnamed protein product, partial [Ixodes persulcatus]